MSALRRLLRREALPAGVSAELLRDLAPDVEELRLARVNAPGWVSSAELRAFPAAQRALSRPREQQPAVVLALLHLKSSGGHEHYYAWTAEELACQLMRRKLPWSETQLVALLDNVIAESDAVWERYHRRGTTRRAPYVQEHMLTGRLPAAERYIAEHGLTDALATKLAVIRDRAAELDAAELRKTVRRINVLLGEADAPTSPLGPLDNPWAQALDKTLRALSDRQPADELLGLAATARGARMPRKYEQEMHELCKRHAAADMGATVGALLSAAAAIPGDRDRGVIPTELGDVLRGLAWAGQVAGGADAARGLGDIALAGWKKVPQRGPLSRKAADAAIGALAHIPEGAAQLGRLRALVKQPQAVASVDAAIDTAAAALGVDRDAFEELVAPDFGLVDGQRREAVGEHTAVIELDDRFTCGLRFETAAGKSLKSVPAAVRENHKEQLAELRAAVKSLTAMTRAQRSRLERLLASSRTWTYADWRARYIEHGLVGALARRLIWIVDGTPVVWVDNELRTRANTPVPEPAADAVVSLWHPVDAPADEVKGWRVFLEERQLRQPFKQAHREVYLLTDAERTTSTYSNRFGAHILKQHQMAALARDRGWRYALQGAWDSDDERATLRLPEHDLTVQFFVDRPFDWADLESLIRPDSGVFLYVTTDQVRFHAGEQTRTPIELAQVPPRVFSEVMRDVDLFVGVASVGNDPQWSDHGQARELTGYWNEYSFGELGEQGNNRADVLSRLLPKLAIADRCELDGRFLRVRGSLRTYKIHLGSTNILMEPNDAYLCIVTASSQEADRVFLPFEGDRGLAVILSKAFLLADDRGISDSTITSQIAGR